MNFFMHKNKISMHEHENFVQKLSYVNSMHEVVYN